MPRDRCSTLGHNYETVEGGFACTDCPSFKPEVEGDTKPIVLAALKQRFPWLGTDESVDGADVIDALVEMYEDFGGEEA
jgi:hypothetical protein